MIAWEIMPFDLITSHITLETSHWKSKIGQMRADRSQPAATTHERTDRLCPRGREGARRLIEECQLRGGGQRQGDCWNSCPRCGRQKAARDCSNQKGARTRCLGGGRPRVGPADFLPPPGPWQGRQTRSLLNAEYELCLSASTLSVAE